MALSNLPHLRLGDPRLRDQPTVRPGDRTLRATMRTLSPSAPSPNRALRRIRLLLITADEDVWLVVRALAGSAEGIDARIEWVDRPTDADVALSRRRFDACIVDARTVDVSWIDAHAAHTPIAALEPGHVSLERLRSALRSAGCTSLG